ncbi:glyoxylate/hydroxypyruvate reductase A [Komagataeibacter sp. FNDCF1]|uniref:2-hydroxyacid dehydrogenase n=1 Tax=Komagataeibacter sp. FNDCF1 TaxID=2878681 RepID=UPI001E409C4C|nr:glyoxylate/hydroxypyruvate reductase A [Komagataeibacter sp. FNDCF1]MCE2566142.1 glyoxylate/hydroxypyruvate reductase A [Komagataeibacter sp. FNDCF1]
MVRLVISSDGPAAVGGWRAAFRAVAPHLQTCSWYDPAYRPGPDDYALVWHPSSADLARMGGLRGIICTGAGVNQLLGDPAFPHHVPLVRMGGAQTAALMADYVLWAVLGLLRDARTWAIQQDARIWRENHVSRTSAETRVGVMGMGHLGAHVAGHLRHAGFMVSGWRRSTQDVPGIRVFAGREALPEFLANVDILVNLLPSTPQTRGMIDHALLARLPRGAGLVNVGRGDHVVQDDLLRALDDGMLGGAVLDVTTPEPLPPDHPLWRHERVTLTPHVASWASQEAQARYVVEVIDQMEHNERPALLYEPARGY